jgi:putative hemolysin
MVTLVLCFALLCGSVSSDKAINEQGKAGIANPASTNCINKGGTLKIQKGGGGGEYGICIFEDNRQCEEWALFRGECPIGGKKITGYVTPAAQFCVITGGSYDITAQTNTEKEQGTCTFNNGKSCDVWDYYNGKCSSNIKQ